MLTLQGASFRTGMTVLVGNTTCGSLNLISANQLTCTLPANSAATLGITAMNSDGSSFNLPNAIVYADSFAAPTVTSVSPNSGSTLGGTSITLTGTGFQTGATVLVDTQACTTPNVVSTTSLTCVTPARATGLVAVRVTNPDAQFGNLNSAYTYVTPPTYTTLQSGLFQSRCASCHGTSGGFSTQIYSQISTRLVPGNPVNSLLYQRVANNTMPTSGGPLSASEKQMIFDWIAAGASNN